MGRQFVDRQNIFNIPQECLLLCSGRRRVQLYKYLNVRGQNHTAVPVTQSQRDACLSGLIYTHTENMNCSTTTLTEGLTH